MSDGARILDRAFGVELLARIEEAGINASAPREQRWIDGWLVRFSPGKAKRARCIQAVAAGRLPVEAKLERCLPVYATAGLRPYVRVTPFSAPAGLDPTLAALGMAALDDTRVMVVRDIASVAASADRFTPDVARSVRLERAAPDAFAQWIGRARGSSDIEIASHADRLRQSPVPLVAVLAFDADDGRPLAGGQIAIEGEVAGLYDVFTLEDVRGRRLAELVCRHLLAITADASATLGYLQVDAANDSARRLYARLGFADAYTYHYRTPASAAP